MKYLALSLLLLLGGCSSFTGASAEATAGPVTVGVTYHPATK